MQDDYLETGVPIVIAVIVLAFAILFVGIVFDTTRTAEGQEPTPLPNRRGWWKTQPGPTPTINPAEEWAAGFHVKKFPDGISIGYEYDDDDDTLTLRECGPPSWVTDNPDLIECSAMIVLDRGKWIWLRREIHRGVKW